MPTKFSEFFTLSPAKADDFQKRIFNAIKDATSIVDCYYKLYDYIVGGLKWSSRQDRYDLMDKTVDLTGLNQLQMEDSRKYFEGSALVDLSTKVLFEYLDTVPKDEVEYGKNVFCLQFKGADETAAQKACRQVQLYSQVQIYNDEWDTQLAYQQTNHLFNPPPKGKIKIDPATPIDPDNAKQFSDLTGAVKELEDWIKENYPVLKLVLNETDLFALVFDKPNFSYEDKIDALQTMLDKIRYLGKNNAATRKQFGTWVIQQVEGDSAFWNNAQISKAYAKIMKLKPQFDKNATKTLKIYDKFSDLFEAFLNPKPYPGEQNANARRTTALGHIKSIFKTFSPSQPRVATVYKETMAKALAQIKDEYDDLYTDDLAKAQWPIPPNSAITPILPVDLANALKEKADECLRTLPLLLADNTEVRFFTIQNYWDLKALNEKSVNVTKVNLLKSSVVVPSDPAEKPPKGNAVEKPRPIYRSIRYSNTVDEFIAFCNMPDLQPGTFYYRHVKDPAVMVVEATNKSGRMLTIDFQNYTIAYPDKKTDKAKNEAGEPYRVGASTVRFYDDLKKITKWSQISGARRYDPYYTTNPTVAHLSGYVSAGRGVSRTLPLGDDNLCVWWWNFNDVWNWLTYYKLGEILGLPISRRIYTVPGQTELRKLNTPITVQIGETQCDFTNYGNRQFLGNDFFHHVIGITPTGEAEQFYVRVNTPTPGVTAALNVYKKSIARKVGRPLEDNPQAVLKFFDFSYYRRITTDPVSLDFSEKSKVIQLFKKGDKRKPSGSQLLPAPWTDQDYDGVGVNLPICFNLPVNIMMYFMDKQTRGKMINKGNVLYREQKPRKDAGTAMKPVYDLMKRPISAGLSAAKMPATAFANNAMAQSLAVREDWSALKLESSNYMPVNQEWCHLRGHGDGGDEYPGNFVSGSYHCNTEQLAIETGQRLVTQQMPERSFVLHTTAYMLRDAIDYKSSNDADRISQILTGNYLENETTYQRMLENNIARRSRELGIVDDNKSEKAKIEMPKPQQGDVAPVAAYIRYKVMRCEEIQVAQAAQGGQGGQTEGKRIKFFDFIFEGQSEFLDVNQFAIISRAVQFALAGGDAFKQWYEQERAELEANAVTTT